ncbi:uncharacterized protein LOC121052561 [Rosa chinensis]|uniref:uncharacterized protein LOC121052561 n=1 Tax=Rosa chinensis TaxID=74649 RepID=UPI001AD90B5D|nr:uncharacterized protein LOC121052561 [Rosa chinensis]
MGSREGSETENPKQNSKNCFQSMQLILNKDTLIMDCILKIMNQLLGMSIGGSSYFQQVNESEAERARRLAWVVDLDLNHPPPSENLALAAPPSVQPQQQSSDAPDDECLIISPRKFEEAMNNSRRNPSRRVRSNIEDFTEDLELSTE